MDIAIVTGAETPLGLHLIERFVRQGFRVHGIGNNLSKVSYADPNFIGHAVDLSDLEAVSKLTAEIMEKEQALDLLVHAIDVTPGGAFEKLPVGNLEAILKVALLGPVMITRLTLPNLLRFRGQLINVIPTNKSGHAPSAVNALIEGGLRSMNNALFDQARDAGLRATNLVLRQNDAPDGLSVQSGTQTHINLEDVARAIELLIDPNYSNVPAELVLTPRASAQSEKALPETALPLDPYSEVVLPPQAYCPPEQPKIVTQEKVPVERTIPYSDDEMEDKIAAAIEDFEAHPERYEPSAKQSRKQSPRGNQQEDDAADGSNKNKRRRGRRRGGRNRNRDRNSEKGEKPTPGEPKAATGTEPQAQPRPQAQNTDKPVNKGSSQPKPQKEARSDQSQKPKRSRKTKAEAKPEKKTANQTESTPQPKKEMAPKPAATSPAEKEKSAPKPVKKAAKKVATKKKAAKKTAAKKAVKKSATKKTPAKKAAKKAAKKKAAKKATQPKEA